MDSKEKAFTQQEDINAPSYVKGGANESDGSSTTPASALAIEAQGFDEAMTKKLLRKLDWHLVPFLSLLYL